MTIATLAPEISTAKAPSLRPLFVVSVWRSGSSLFYSLLNQHSKIALLYEGELPQLELYLRGHFQKGTWRERWEFWNQGPSRHGIALETMPEKVSDAWEATRVVYQEVARRKHAEIWGEKTPHWFDRALYMSAKFPDARFIFLWRNMNGVMESIARASRTERFFRKPGFTTKVLLGYEQLKTAYDTLKAEGRAVHEVDYEDLTSNTEQCMRGVCQFLEIPFEPHIASLQGADRSAICSGDHHTLVRSNHIAGKRKQEEVLSHHMKAKISRYICRWKQRNNGVWPKYPLDASQDTRPPRVFELVGDRIAYEFLLSWDSMVKVTYSFVPISVAELLRSWIRRRSYTKPLIQVSPQ